MQLHITYSGLTGYAVVRGHQVVEAGIDSRRLAAERLAVWQHLLAQPLAA